MSAEHLRPEETLDTYFLHGQSLRRWHEFLTTDHETGESTAHLVCPTSRYGKDADDNAWWAVATELIYCDVNGWNGEEGAADGLEWCMGLCVNDHPDVAEMVNSYWYVVPACLREQLGTEDEVRQLMGGGSNGAAL